MTSSRQERRDWMIVIASGAVLATLAILALLLATHVIAPLLFTHYGTAPQLANLPVRAVNAKGIPGDPINVAIVASSDEELATAFGRAHWVEALPVTRASSLGIARSVLFNRPDSAGPVSPLYLYGRVQDHAFEQEVSRSARRRHHVRLWRAPNVLVEGRPVWVGGATFDERAGISRRGFHPTHHIDPDVDRERDAVDSALASAGQVEQAFHITGLGPRVNSRNAEGDRFDTDGELLVIVVPVGNLPHAAPGLIPDPPLVELKNRLWRWFHRR